MKLLELCLYEIKVGSQISDLTRLSVSINIKKESASVKWEIIRIFFSSEYLKNIKKDIIYQFKILGFTSDITNTKIRNHKSDFLL